jgi:universal stress protein A
MLPAKILLCTDFSENSDSAQKYALEYAKALGSQVLALHVVDLWAGVPTYDEGVYVYVKEAVGRLEETAKSKLETFREACSSTGADVTTLCVTGIPAEEIVRVAEDQGVGLVVMGTHGWTGLKHILLGSVAEKVLRTARIPVMVVRSGL